MATLSVLKLDDPGGADRVLIALPEEQERQLREAFAQEAPSRAEQ